jgi:hypothetical protein
MKTVQDTYPVFEANQVLSNAHLNQLFDYLGEQERLTRANLIGTGISCGLALRLDGGTLHLSPGCGTTTEGYLVVESDAAELTAYREYTLPLDVDYLLLRDKSQPGRPSYPLWELFPAGEPDTTPVSSPDGFLDNKAVLLFVELKKGGLRNCSPNDCNDRGSQLVVAVRRLLIGVDDLAKVIAEGAAEGSGLTTADLEALALSRLNLPDLRLPRYDVPNTSPTTSEQVLATYRKVFADAQLAAKAKAAFSAAYAAFKPLLQEQYASDPFSGFSGKFGFLGNGDGDSAQILFLQYYYGLFDDLLRAYDEMRWKGVELVCSCVPSELLFPRHLMLGVPKPIGVNAALYRNGFAPACAGEELRGEFLALFARLVGIADSFTHQPPLPAANTQIRITPSTVGTQALACRAIPYYYTQAGATPLYQRWSPERTRRGRANQNLGYRSTEYVPAAPAFVTDALRYDLEPNNFLRIEGHLGKPYQQVLATLLTLRNQYRLPIEVIALRTGAFDESAPLVSGESARWSDLEALYDVLREQILDALTEGIRFLYETPADSGEPAGTPKHPLLKKRAPQFNYQAGAIGAWYEKYLGNYLARPYIDVDQNNIDLGAILMVYCGLFTGTTGLQGKYYPQVVSIYYMTKLSETLPDKLDALAYADFENKCQDLLALTRNFRGDSRANVPGSLSEFVPQEDLVDHFDQILYGCNLQAVHALVEEFQRRLRQLKQQQVLGYFLQQHPGIQHKAGVPLGGTFILVYHQQDAAAAPQEFLFGDLTHRSQGKESVKRALRRLGGDMRYADDPDMRELISALGGEGGGNTGVMGAAGTSPIAAALEGVGNGAVIADFYLPYRVGGDGPAIEYVLPLPPLGLSIALGCTDASGSALATLTPEGGMAPISYQLDGQPYQLLAGPVALAVGEHTLAIRDSAGAESAPQDISVPSQLRLGEPEYQEDPASMTWRASIPILGGVLPYTTSSGGAIDINRYLSESAPSGDAVKVEISDSAGCATGGEYSHEVEPACDLPCEGVARRCGFRFWMPDGDRERPFKETSTEVASFKFEFREGKVVDLGGEVQAILAGIKPDDLNASYDKVVNAAINNINKLVAKAVGSDDWFILKYDVKTLGMPVLWIEYFSCLHFEIRLAFRGVQGENQFSIDSSYTPEGTALFSGRVRIPPFNCATIHKCDPNRPVEQGCKGLDLKLEISAKSAGRDVIALSANAVGPEPVLYLWEVQETVPIVAEGKTTRVTVTVRQPYIKNIRLTAYTEEGCVAVATSQINLG